MLLQSWIRLSDFHFLCSLSHLEWGSWIQWCRRVLQLEPLLVLSPCYHHSSSHSHAPPTSCPRRKSKSSVLWLRRLSPGGFPGGPVVKTPCCHCSSIPGRGTKILHATQHSPKKKLSPELVFTKVGYLLCFMPLSLPRHQLALHRHLYPISVLLRPEHWKYNPSAHNSKQNNTAGNKRKSTINETLLYSMESYIHYLVITCIRKESEKRIYVCMYVYILLLFSR